MDKKNWILLQKAKTGLDPGSDLGQSFRSRIRDKFRPIGAPAKTAA
ncbi:hypothetical protein SCG7086_AG_00220 [Chlamydiales bacterium SCGC AG-110-P3]|nr:hypothetical protein SCG7086_AG_00220 [Chlamydiales bacterium SCGC AG-110-P3]